MSQPQFEVQLVVYDLSRGMALGLSSQFLGPDHAIEVIPHTGVVAYGLEYFFGGSGIQSENPQQFRASSGMQPIQVHSAGQTSVTKLEFETWCQRMVQTGEYSGPSYDLLSHNCNNFSHDALTKCMGFSGSVFPSWILDVPRRFLSSPMGQIIRPMLQNMQVTNVPGAEAVTPQSSARASAPDEPVENPWATMETKQPKIVQGTPTLDSFTKPLLSNDTKTVTFCIQKIAQTDSAKEIFEKARPILISSDLSLSFDLTESVCSILAVILENSASSRTFALMLLRLVVLRCYADPVTVSYRRIMLWLSTNLGSGSLKENSNALTMALLAASNVCRASNEWTNGLVEAAVRSLADHRKEVRQASTALLYNASLILPRENDGLSDTCISILCSVLENIDDEMDTIAKLRRLLVVGRLIKSKVGATDDIVTALVVDLGFQESIERVSVDLKTDPRCKALATEVLGLLQK